MSPVRRTATGLVALGSLALTCAPAHAKDKAAVPHVYGPEPSWEQFRTIGEAGVRARLIDPDSAKIDWSGGFHKGEYKPFLEARVAGYVACGTVNARNRMGGYAGASAFVVVIDYDRVLYADLDRNAGGMVGEQCSKAIAAELFPLVPASAAASASSTAQAAAADPSAALTSAASGLTLRAMPDGAYVSAVAAGSPAATAGLKPGMVIASVNAIPLAGLGEAMLKVVDAAGASAALTIVGGSAVKLDAPK